MTSDLSNMEVDDGDDRALPGSDPEPGSHERSLRLKEAVREAGGPAAVASRAGIPKGTLFSYLRGRDMRAGAMVDLARAAGVRLEWLATGEGPMRHETSEVGALEAGGELGGLEPGPAPQGAPAGPPPRLFSLINADRLGDAFAAARQALALRGQYDPEPRRLMQITVLIYDSLTDIEGGKAASEDNPQDHPQKDPQPGM